MKALQALRDLDLKRHAHEPLLDRDRKTGEWGYSTRWARNHLFDYEQKQAEIAKREQER